MINRKHTTNILFPRVFGILAVFRLYFPIFGQQQYKTKPKTCEIVSVHNIWLLSLSFIHSFIPFSIAL